MQNYDLARLAYTAYGDSTNWKNHQGNLMPNWIDLPESIKHAWKAASDCVYNKAYTDALDEN